MWTKGKQKEEGGKACVLPLLPSGGWFFWLLSLSLSLFVLVIATPTKL